MTIAGLYLPFGITGKIIFSPQDVEGFLYAALYLVVLSLGETLFKAVFLQGLFGA
ncbi:hypothetical protein [Suttonella indologenes]|uniref:hypothetical protein n=1 Tax=Suttonella indologenes TaxID=13276 RepID=UPI001559B83A|nr:hypothetical protein [Suttonella indologenes]